MVRSQANIACRTLRQDHVGVKSQIKTCSHTVKIKAHLSVTVGFTICIQLCQLLFLLLALLFFLLHLPLDLRCNISSLGGGGQTDMLITVRGKPTGLSKE